MKNFFLFILFIAFLSSSVVLYSCDDSILAFFSEKNQSEELIHQMLLIARHCREMAEKIDAFNKEAAETNMSEIIDSWIKIETSGGKWLGSNISTTAWETKKQELGELLGKVRKLFIKGDFQATHDFLELVVCKLSETAATLCENKPLSSILAQEFIFLNLKEMIKNGLFRNAASELASARKILWENLPLASSTSEFWEIEEKLSDHLSRFSAAPEPKEINESLYLQQKLLQVFNSLVKKLFPTISTKSNDSL
ncbi:MAG: hypothetical protein HQM08_08160 [Candidatus Riflebacteria bacterium]|nr:hypothetical protein [Candidatus Riflebacteria bacterium]